MAEMCIACEECLTIVTPPCGHRQYCRLCFERSQEAQNSARNCPTCQEPVVPIVDSRAVQLQPVTLADALVNYDELKNEYPFGALLFGEEKTLATQDLFQTVREALEAVKASKIELNDLKKALRQRLTLEQFDMVFVELTRNEDLHGVLKQLDKRKFEKRSITTKVQQMVVRLIESLDKDAVAYRAVFATALGSGFDLVTGGMAGFGACTGSNLVVFLCFTALEMYRWSKDGSSAKELAKNVGEHAAGALGGALGAYHGFYIGASLGSAVFQGKGTSAAVGGVVGSIIGGFCFDTLGRVCYREFLPDGRTETTVFDETKELYLTKRELAEKAAAKLCISVDLDSFEEAHARFRRCLLAKHPDKHPGASGAERQQLTEETADILACWNVVREYYKERGDVENSECGEGFVKAFVLKVFDTTSQQWRVVRAFFDDVILGRYIDPTKEKLEVVKVYV